ncbi:hypothetical protein [uncultured Erythrobacter sp.]|uniref:hypothetical protein n=1 Tax=uncultured Erythrobacter sp. TaxID=263913 RepID=UPI00260E3FC7|nr:hypothetical protein [uncultured Erythrobacter sp.]
MAELKSASDRQKAVDSYLRAANVGAVTLVLFSIFDFYDTVYGPADLDSALSIVLLVCVVAFLWAMVHLFRHRDADEFTLALWHSGVTAAFIALIVWALFGNMITGLYWGLTADVQATESAEMQMVDYWTAPVCIAAFFVAFHIKRFRGH